jgi:hypothetical protein
MKLRTGDVLVSQISARIEHEVSIVPGPAEVVCPSHNAANRTAREIAQQRHVDAWLTSDHVHLVRIGAYRPETVARRTP